MELDALAQESHAFVDLKDLPGLHDIQVYDEQRGHRKHHGEFAIPRYGYL